MRRLFNRRTLKIGAASLVGVVLTFGLIGLVLVRTGKLDDWLAAQFKSSLANYGVRLEIGRLQIFVPSFKVEMRDLKFYAEGEAEPFAALDHLAARVTTKRLLGFIGFGRKSEVRLEELTLDGLRAAYKIDAAGRSSFDKMHLPKQEKLGPFDFTYSAAQIELRNIEFTYVDRPHKLSGTARNLSVTLRPHDWQPLAVIASADASSFVFDGRESKEISFKLDGKADEKGAEVESLRFDSPFTAANLKGRLDDWRAPTYKLNAKAEIKLREVARTFLPDVRLSGAVSFEGTVEGHGVEYQAKGKLRGEELQARDVRIGGFSLTASGKGKGGEYNAQEEWAFRQLDALGFRVNRVVAAGRIAGDGRDFSWLGNFRAAELSGPDVQASGLSFNEALIKGDFARPATWRVKGKARIDRLVTADVPVGNITGEVTATRDELTLPDFSGTIFGGATHGSARVRLDGRGASEVNAELSQLNLDQAAAVAAGKRLPIRGAADGHIKLAWQGNDYKSAAGAANLKFNGATLHAGDGPTTDAAQGGAEQQFGGDAAPISGELNAVASERKVRFENTKLVTGATRLTLGGEIGWDKTGAVDFTLDSSDAAQLQSLALDFAGALNNETIKTAIEATRKSEVQLTKKLHLDGRVSGSLDAPQVKSRFALAAVNIADEPLGAMTGEVAYENDAVRVTAGRLMQEQGGEADFTLNYPLGGENVGTAQARLRQFALGTALRLAVSLPVPVAGAVTGAADVTGLPNAVRANADFKIANARVGDSTFDEAGGHLTFSGTRVELSALRLRSGAGALAGSLAFDSSTMGYRANLRGDGLDLNQFVNTERDREAQLPVTGHANIQIDAECAKFELGEKRGRIFDRLDLTATSDDLSFRGTKLGRTQLKLDGRDSKAQIALNADLFGYGYVGKGDVDLGDPSGPLRLTMDFNDVSLAPVIDVAAGRDLEASGKASGQLRVRGNLLGTSDPAHIEVDFSQLGFEVGDYRIAAQPPVTLKINSNQMDFGTVHFAGTNTNLEMTGSVALSDKGRNNFAVDGDVNLKLLQSFVPNVYSEGVIRLQGAASGTHKQPRFSGTATLQDGVLRSPSFPVALTKANGRLLFTADQAQLETFSAQVGGGKVNVVGGASFAGLQPNRWRLQLKTEGVRIDYPRNVRSTLDGDLELQGSSQLQVLSGFVNVRRTEYLADTDLYGFIENMIAEFGNTTIGGADEGSGLPPTQLDVRVIANDTLTLRTKSLDVVGSAALRLRGPANDPTIGGRITVTRGTIDNLFNERYRLTGGTIEFSGVDQILPRLNLEAETERLGYRLIVTVSGNVEQLRVAPRSEPPLPEADVVALITTGRLANEGGTTNSSQALARNSVNTIASFIAQPVSRSIESNVTGRLFGLNRFSIDPLLTGRGTDPTARITVGRRVTKDLSITYSTNLASNQDQVILVEYRASDRLSFVASRAQTGTFGLDVRLRKRF